MIATSQFSPELLENGRPSAIVTGGSRGIGRAIVLALVEAGANVAFTYKSDSDSAREVAREAKSLGGNTLPLQADAADYVRAQVVVREATTAFGPPAILVNNAGTNRDTVIWKMNESSWDEVVDLNLKGCFNYLRAAAGTFREKRRGKIVNITSINGLRGKFGQSNYSASKAGIVGLTKTVARELGPYQVNVNAIAPGLIETAMSESLLQEIKEKALKETVLGRLGQPEDVARVTLFLCGPSARHITGEIIKVDGGQYL